MMRKKLAVFVVAPAIALLCPGTAWAQQAPDDAACFLLGSAYGRAAKDEKLKASLEKVTTFYLGRLVGTAAQIEARIATQARTITPQNGFATLQACAQAAEEKRLQLGEIGRKLAPPTK